MMLISLSTSSGKPRRCKEFFSTGTAASEPAMCERLHLEGLYLFHALTCLLDKELRFFHLAIQALPAGLIVCLVSIGKAYVGHILRQAAQHGQLEKGLGKELHLVADL